MFLRSLSIKGFKSFADPASLIFEPGVTVVVGPNGSGKSNVVDAIAWVLGSQSASKLRSGQMEDVIFAGSSDRPALGRAEVSLTIDNSSGRLPHSPAEVTITRTLFRSGGSEYAMNGTTCRLVDIQELLSDSGVGRQQHVIVGQGRLDQVLNASAEDRRAIIEEAAGVLTHRKRRERAQRRLAATAENLERLGDLVRELKRQMRPLERQASATRTHASLDAERRSLRLYLAGRELAAFEERRRRQVADRDVLSAEEAEAGTIIEELDREIDQVSADLAVRREEDLSSSIARMRGLVERCRGLGALVEERRRSMARELDVLVDADVVATLEAEVARASSDLALAEEEVGALEPDRQRMEEAERELVERAVAGRAALVEIGNARARRDALVEARGRVEPSRRALDRDRTELARAGRRVEGIEARLTERREAVEAASQRLEASRAEIVQRDEEARRAAEEARESESAAEGAESHLRQVERQSARAQSRAEALSRAVSELGAAGAGASLEHLDGVVGPLLALVEIDEGWEAAFRAAVGSAVSAIAVEGRVSARAAFTKVREDGSLTALVALGEGASGAGERVRPASPRGTEPVSGHVRARVPNVRGTLERLLGGAVAVDGGWSDALDAAIDHPELTVVTLDGDRFAPSGWRAAAAGADLSGLESAASRQYGELAARLPALSEKAELARAEAVSKAKVAAAASLAEERARRAADAELERMRRAEEDAQSLEAELDHAVRARSELGERVERDADLLGKLEAQLPELEQAAASATGEIALLEEAQRELDDARSRAERLRRSLEVREAAIGQRREMLSARVEELERRLADRTEERERAAGQRIRIESSITVLDRLDEVLERDGARLDEISSHLGRLRSSQLSEARSAGDRLERLRRERGASEGRLQKVRESLQRLEIEMAEGRVRHDAAVDSLERDLGLGPEGATSAVCPELPEGVTPEARLQKVESDMSALGPVNPLALQELSELEERHSFLEAQVADVRRGRQDLLAVIRAVDDEIVQTFAEAFADVNSHFSDLVSRLFPGGGGKLLLVDPEDLLGTGVEVEARPPGKNVRRLSLLSGGERSLVALAFLFAVFRSRPSPFYVMDEVEAALDDVNLHRFLDLVRQFRDEAQLIIVSHQKRTMEAADALYGVTMARNGSSKVVSQKVKEQGEGDLGSAD
jgi:chromosome segregation protein